MTDMNKILADARSAADALAKSSTDARNAALQSISKALIDNQSTIIAENAKDVEAAKAAGRPDALVDRLTLTPGRIALMADALDQIVALPDPVGEVGELSTRPNGLRVGRMRIPLGVIAIVFEARPNVVTDAGALCLKSGNAVILRGGSEAEHSNRAIGGIVSVAVAKAGLPAASIQVLDDTDRAHVMTLLQARGKVDLLIPRGGEGLIRFVDEHARVPLVLHYKGVCHVYVDRAADLEKAYPITQNAKVQRPGVCNAAETLLVHAAVADEFLPNMSALLKADGVELRGCEETLKRIPDAKPAEDADWDAEYLDLILAVKVVPSFDAALDHIAKHSSLHTETIITEDLNRAARFLQQVQSSAVMVNASTRFNDGGELGLGAEIGISTTKLHAFGPMGLRELTTKKFIVMGTGQVRG